MPDSAAPLTQEEFLQAIQILPLESQQEMLQRIRAEGGITVDHGREIAALLDAVIGDPKDLVDERMELDEVSRSLSKQGGPAHAASSEEVPGLDWVQGDMRETYDRWFSDTQQIERDAGARLEREGEAGNRAQMEVVRRGLKSSPKNN